MRKRPVSNRTLTAHLQDSYSAALAKANPSAQRKSRLRAYTLGVVSALLDHVQAEALSSDELIVCLSAAALFVHKTSIKKAETDGHIKSSGEPAISPSDGSTMGPTLENSGV